MTVRTTGESQLARRPPAQLRLRGLRQEQQGSMTKQPARAKEFPPIPWPGLARRVEAASCHPVHLAGP